MARILIADDTHAIADIVENLLKNEGHEVRKGYNGQEAIDILSADPASYDLIITDMLMPKKDGFDVIAHVKDTRPTTQIIVMTGGGVAITPAEVIKSVGDDIANFLTKPIGKADLLEAVNAALS